MRIHSDIILPVDTGKMSVDEAYSKLVRLIYGVNNYLSLSFKEKLQFILEFAYVSYAAENDSFSQYHLDNVPNLLFYNPNDFPN